VSTDEIRHCQVDDKRIISLIRQAEIVAAGHLQSKIYGRLKCLSGKRMLRKNRVFFYSFKQAISLGYRPCAHCMAKEYAIYTKSLS